MQRTAKSIFQFFVYSHSLTRFLQIQLFVKTAVLSRFNNIVI